MDVMVDDIITGVQGIRGKVKQINEHQDIINQKTKKADDKITKVNDRIQKDNDSLKVIIKKVLMVGFSLRRVDVVCLSRFFYCWQG